MAKCEICAKRVDLTFLEKVIGTYIKDSKGKMHLICYSCQKIHINKQAILEKLRL